MLSLQYQPFRPEWFSPCTPGPDWLWKASLLVKWKKRRDRRAVLGTYYDPLAGPWPSIAWNWNSYRSSSRVYKRDFHLSTGCVCLEASAMYLDPILDRSLSCSEYDVLSFPRLSSTTFSLFSGLTNVVGAAKGRRDIVFTPVLSSLP